MKKVHPITVHLMFIMIMYIIPYTVLLNTKYGQEYHVIDNKFMYILIFYILGCLYVTLFSFRKNYHKNMVKLPYTKQIIIPFIFLSTSVLLFAFASNPLFEFIKSGFDGLVADEARGNTLKGDYAVLAYAFSIIVTALLPLAAIAKLHRSRYLDKVFLFLAFFIVLSTLVKAMFFNIIIPMIFYFYLVRRNGLKFIIIYGSATCITLLLIIQVIVPFDFIKSLSQTDNYFSVHYRPANALEFFVWRASSIPLQVALDTLVVHQVQYNDLNLGVSTSGVLSTLAGVEKINLETEVFSYQYGGNSGFGNANTGALIEGFVSFGYPGAFLFGVVVASFLHFMFNVNSIDLRSTSYLYAILLVYSSLFATLFSGGLILILALAVFGRAKL